jgi:hypothetical protein
LFGGDLDAIGVALYSVEEAGGWVVELPKQAADRERRLEGLAVAVLTALGEGELWSVRLSGALAGRCWR